MPLYSWLEGMELVLVIVSMIAALRYLPEGMDTEDDDHSQMEPYPETFQEAIPVSLVWNAHNIFNPFFEKYSYSDAKGLRIQRGFLKKEYIKIPVQMVSLRINQSFTQRLFGICTVSFISNYQGDVYGTNVLKNVKKDVALQLYDYLM